MAPDGVLVGLIAQSVLSESVSRRRAAGILVELLRSGENVMGLRAELKAVQAPLLQPVADEARTLIVCTGSMIAWR
jgi:hypothetical protein